MVLLQIIREALHDSMSNHHNPNTSDGDINPFANTGNVAPFGIALDTAESIRRKERELQAREEDLIRREEAIRRQEEALTNRGVTVEQKNWPPFYPVMHHDIEADIPVYLRKLQYIAFVTFLGVPATLLWNIIANVAAWTGDSLDGRFFFLSIIYFILGPIGAYYLWYRALYRALRSDKGLSFGTFFFYYLVHIVVFIFAAVGPPIIFNGLYFAGLMTAVEIFPEHHVIGLFYFVAFGLFAVEAIVSIWVYQQVFRHFRSGKVAEPQRGTTWPNGGAGV